MEKFIKFAKKYNIGELLLIFAVSAVLFFLFYGKQDVYLVDVSREAYLPWQVMKGQVLYKDIFNVYGPVGYQINALLYYIFGVNLNTLYFAGFINSLVILFTVFYTTRLFARKRVAIAVCGLVVFVCAYAKNFFNFIFSYSYNALYALSGFLLSLFFALVYIKEKKTKDLVLAFLFAGFSFANKIEDLPYFCLLFLLLPFWLKKDWKKYLYAIGAFFAVPVVSFGILLLQGASFNDFIEAFVLIKKLVNAPATNFFYYQYGLYFNPQVVATIAGMVLKAIKMLWLPFVVLFVINYAGEKYVVQKWVKTVIKFLSVCFSVYVVVDNFKVVKDYYESIFCWMGMACLLIFAVAVVYILWRIFKQKVKIEQIPQQDKMFLFLLTAALCVSLKGLFSVIITCYGTFTLTAMFMPFVIFLVVYVPLKMPENIKKAWCSAVMYFCIMAMASCFFYNIHRVVTTDNYAVVNPQGFILIRDFYPAQNELIKYIREKTPKNAKILVVPEGSIINFLAQRDSDNRYYYLIPVNVDIFGQERILNDIKKNPPDYVLLADMLYRVYAQGGFCDYAGSVCSFIKQEYAPEFIVKGLVTMTLYRKK